MENDLNSGSSARVILERIDAKQNVARFYMLSIEPTPFAEHTFIRCWGRIGSAGRHRLQFCDGLATAELELEIWLTRKRRRGYEFATPLPIWREPDADERE